MEASKSQIRIGWRGRKAVIKLSCDVAFIQVLIGVATIESPIDASIIPEIHDIRICWMICIDMMVDMHFILAAEVGSAVRGDIKIDAGAKDL